ncbi:MAG: hypothetical protein Q4Q53_04835 [Methanocorpusculum sp.]|nr:hypothetical protein [Methanocorpusculum sp.]
MIQSVIQPASRLFASEFNLASEAEGGFKTPFGVFSSKIFIVGTLTEKVFRNNNISALRVSDPTGVFNLNLNWNNKKVMSEAEAIDAPSFVSVFASINFRKFGSRVYTEIIPEVISPSNRKARDTWICDCALSSFQRLEKSADSDLRKDLRSKIIQALTAAKPKEPAKVLSDAEIFEIIESLYEKKGAPIVNVLKKLSEAGMDESSSKAILERMAEDGDLYSPTKETIKVA